jgi:phytoene desaturase
MVDRFRKLPESAFDAIVVGAGMGGLTTAALLAERGRRVLVVDQHYVAGGNATIFKRRGYEFDVGLHYIGDCGRSGLIPRILRAAGAPGVVFEEMDPDGFDTLVFPDFEFRIPRGIEAFRRRLVAQFPAERRGIDRYLAVAEQIRRYQTLLGNPLHAVTVLPRSLLLFRYLRATLAELLDDCTRDPRLRAVLCGQHGDYAQPPSRASALMHVGLAQHYLEGAFFPRGGGQVLADRLAESIERRGGKILLRARARRILVERGAACGVEIESHHLGVRVVRAPVVVSNADLKRTMAELVGAAHLAPETTRRVASYEMSPALGVVYLGIRRDLRAEGHPRTNYWISPAYDLEPAYAELRRGEISSRPLVYISIASVKDPENPRLAPPGLTNLQLMTIVPAAPSAWGVTEADVASGAYRDHPGYLAKKKSFAAALVAGAERVLPDLRGQIVYEEVATPLTHRRFTLATDGTSYGIALTPRQYLGGRPGAGTEIRGLYLCGASTRAGHGIAGAMMSGVLAAASISGRGLVREVFGDGNAG